MFSIFSFRYQAGALAFLMDKAGEGSGGGGGSGDGKDGKTGDGKDGKGSGAGGGDELAALKAANAALEARLAKIEAAGKGKGDPDPDDESLADKARKEREAKEKGQADSKALEKAITYTLGAKDWLKENESLLPKTIPGIFEQADKKNYGSAIEKAAETKLALVSEFFAVKENLDLLTDGQKSALADFNALTETVKRDRVQTIFETVFEPTFENIKRVRKAEQLNKGGGNPSGAESAFEKKMQGYSKKLYLKEKGN